MECGTLDYMMLAGCEKGRQPTFDDSEVDFSRDSAVDSSSWQTCSLESCMDVTRKSLRSHLGRQEPVCRFPNPC